MIFRLLGCIQGSGSGVDPLAPGPDAPTFAFVDATTTDATPNVDIGLPSGNGNHQDAAADDVVQVYADDVLWFQHTLTAQNIIDGTVTVTGVSNLSDGTRVGKARLTRSGAETSDFSATDSIVIDATAPTITSANSGNCAENATLSHSLTANESVTWAIRTAVQNAASVDHDKFEISGSTLRWAANGTKDFETPDDADTNNTYIVVVRATDTLGNTTDQTITITVTDVDEGVTPNNARLVSTGNFRIVTTGNYRITA